MYVIRGGTSRGVYFRASDLPDDPAARDAVILRAFHGDLGVLADGLGGENPVLRKSAVIEPLPAGEDGRPALSYLFGQVTADLAGIDRSVECGNIASGVPLLARLAGWLPSEPSGEVWINMVNTNRRVLASWADWSDVGGSVGLTFEGIAPGDPGQVLPTKTPRFSVAVDGRSIEASIIQGMNTYLFVDGPSIGMSDPANQSVTDELFEILREIITQVSGRLAPGVTLKVCVLAPGHGPTPALSGCILYVAERRVHESFAVTGAATLALACCLPDTVPNRAISLGPGAAGMVIKHPSGELPLRWALGTDGLPSSVTIQRSCRLIMSGSLY